MKMKSLLAFILVIMITLLQSTNVSAHTLLGEGKGLEGVLAISPQWDNVNDITLDMYYENGEVNCYGKIRALSGTTKISAVFTLERKVSSRWVSEKSWSQSSSNKTLTFYETYKAPTGYTYRLSVKANVTRNGSTESVDSSVTGSY